MKAHIQVQKYMHSSYESIIMDVYEWTDSVLVADLQLFYFFPNTEMFSCATMWNEVRRSRGLQTATILDRKTLETQLGLFIVIEMFTRLLPEQDRHAAHVPAPPHSI